MLAEATRFRKALSSPLEAQRSVLARLVSRNAQSSFGREHDFSSIKGIEDFQTRVPVRSYAEHEPWIARMAAGEKGVLTAEPVRYFQESSGTAQAAKLLPSTRGLRGDFSRAIAPWIAEIYHPARKRFGPAYWQITPPAHHKRRTTSGIPIGFESDASYLGGWAERITNAFMAVPPDVCGNHDLQMFRFRTLSHLLRHRDLRVISVWHPSFLQLLLDSLRDNFQALVRDISTHDPVRAMELDHVGPQHISTLWPRLSLISAWGHAHARGAFQALVERVPLIEFQAKGLFATEAVISVPYRGQYPLAIRSHFLEFMDSAGRICTAAALKRDHEYSVIVTTSGGLYRYTMNDRVRVNAFLHGTPCIEFLGKEDHISDLRGEKLSEEFVSSVIRAVIGSAPFAMLAPEPGDMPRYVLYLESPHCARDTLNQEIENALQANPHYRTAVFLGQLRPVAVRTIRSGYAQYTAHLMKNGLQFGNIKPAALSKLSDWNSVFEFVNFDKGGRPEAS